MTTTKITDSSQSFSPRLAGAIFFAIYSFLLILFLKYTLLALRDSGLMPLFPSIFFALLIGALAGTCFGKMLAKKSSWKRPFFIGILLACLSLILISVVLLAYYYFNEKALFLPLMQKKAFALMYLQILIFLSLAIGTWFIPLTGLIGIYFNKQFFPGLIATDQRRMEKENSTETKRSDDNL